MSTINKYPIIKKIIDLMDSSEISFVENFLNTKEIKNSYSFKEMPEHHDICIASIQNANYKPISGILWNTRDENKVQLVDDYYLIDLLRGEFVYFYHIVNDNFTRVREVITLLEVRHWMLEYISQKGITSLLYDDATLGAPTSEKVDAFVRSQGFGEKDFNRIRVIISSSKAIWTYISLPSPQWIGGGSDVVDPFTNSSQGTLVGAEQNGYVEHLTGDSQGLAHIHGWDTKLDKADVANVVYANNNVKTPITIAYDINATSKSIVQRDVNGRIYAGSATSDSHVVNLAQANNLYVNKSTSTDTKTAYARINGVETNYPLDATETANTIPLRDDGGKISANDATSNKNVVNLGQLNTKLDGYVKIVADGNILYGRDATDEVSLSYSQSANAKSIVQRDNNGRMNTVAGVDEMHAVNVSQLNAVSTRIDNLETIGRYLSSWKADEGKPATEPTTALPYVYKRGDYYVVSVVGTTNYRPVGTQYDGSASTVEETNAVSVNDIYRFDGTKWDLTHYAAGSYIAAHDGTGTGTTHLENVIVTGDTTIDDIQVNGDATFVGSVTIPDAINPEEAIAKGQVDKRILSLATAPTTATVGVKGQLAFAQDTAKLYHCSAISGSNYTWSEFTGGSGTPDNASIIKNVRNELAVSYGGKYVESSASLVVGITVGDQVATNIYKVTSTGTPELDNFGEGETLKGTLTAGGTVNFEGVAASITIPKGDGSSGETFDFIGVKVLDSVPGLGVAAYFGKYVDEISGVSVYIVAIHEGDASAIINNIQLNVNKVGTEVEAIKPQVIPHDESIVLNTSNQLKVALDVNPTLEGTESSLTALEFKGVKYKISGGVDVATTAETIAYLTSL